jgi:hypothetical protein
MSDALPRLLKDWFTILIGANQSFVASALPPTYRSGGASQLTVSEEAACRAFLAAHCANLCIEVFTVPLLVSLCGGLPAISCTCHFVTLSYLFLLSKFRWDVFF